MNSRSMIWLSAALLLLGYDQASAATEVSAIKYSIDVKFDDGKIMITHRISNSGDFDLCFFPSDADISRAELSGAGNKKIDNVSNYGFVTEENSLFLVRHDGKEKYFEAPGNNAEVVRPRDGYREIRKVSFRLRLLKCGDLFRNGKEKISPKFVTAESLIKP